MKKTLKICGKITAMTTTITKSSIHVIDLSEEEKGSA